MFVDKVTIRVRGGAGGNGCVSFRRERFLPKGGPDGGDGGDGGSIVISGDLNKSSLRSLKYKNQYEAENGLAGAGQCMHGRRGKDVILAVPIGSVIKDISCDPPSSQQEQYLQLVLMILAARKCWYSTIKPVFGG